MEITKYSTLQIDQETREMLRVLANKFERTMAGQLRFMVRRDFELEQVKENNTTQQDEH